MSRTVTRRPRARLDLLEQYLYFGEQSGAELGERYLAAVEHTCARLSQPLHRPLPSSRRFKAESTAGLFDEVRGQVFGSLLQMGPKAPENALGKGSVPRKPGLVRRRPGLRGEAA